MDLLDRMILWLRDRRLLLPACTLLFFGLFYLVQRGTTPVILLIPGFLLAVVLLLRLDLRYVWLLGAAAMPASLNLGESGPAAITLPSDILAIGLMLLAFLKRREAFTTLARTATHPIFWLLCLWLGWMLVTCIPSSMPVVSIKFWLNAFWYFMGFFFFTLMVMRRSPATLTSWLWATAPVLALVLVFTLLKHSLQGFSYLTSYHIMAPFYKEHTAYAASIAIYAAAFGIVMLGERRRSRRWMLAGAMAGLTFLAVVFSFTRGAWLGLMLAGGFWFLAKFWSWAKYVLLLLLAGVGLWLSVMFAQDSSDKKSNSEKKSFAQHFTTAFDVKSNTSNKERLNRWVAAAGMLQERPVFGFGPGTYAFQYAPFQRSRYRTYVSTNQGDVGTAHNEFLLAASEQGIVAPVIILVLFIVSTYYGMRGYRRARTPWRRTAYAAAFTGLLTYYAHAVVNNFLDQDKVAIPVFICLAMIVALDRLHPEPETPAPYA